MNKTHVTRCVVPTGEPFVHFSRLSGSARPIYHLQRDTPFLNGIYTLSKMILVHSLCYCSKNRGAYRRRKQSCTMTEGLRQMYCCTLDEGLLGT
jgi:hypothetical protein